MGGGEVATDHLAAPAAFEADHKITAKGSVNGNGGIRSRSFSGRSEPSERSVDGGDKVREFACRDRIIGYVAADDFGNER